MSEENAVYDPIHRPANPLSRDVAHLQNDVQELRGKLSSLVDQFNALVKGQDELSEMVHNLMAATAPEVQDEFAELRRQRDQDRYWMDGLDKRIDLIVQRLNAEQREGHLASAAPETYVRINVTKQSKGYVHESTVSLRGNDRQMDMEQGLADLLRMSDTLARDEIARREALDRAVE